MSLLEQVYSRVPVVVQNIGVSLYGRHLARRRYSRRFHETVELLRSRERWDADRFAEYQLQRVREMCQGAMRSSFYAQRFLQVDLDDGRAIGDLGQVSGIPRLTKDEFRRFGRALLTEPMTRDAVVYKSSGTTGTPSEIIRTARTDQEIWAYWEARCWNWFGASYRSRKAAFGVRKVHPVSRFDPPYWRTDWLNGFRYFSVYHIAPGTLDDYVEALIDFAPEVVTGYPSGVLPVAQHMVETGRRLTTAKGVVTTSETISEEQKVLVAEAFGCPVYDQYGAGEACLFSSTCEAGRLHISPDFGYVEVLREDGQPAGPGEVGEVVCTGFVNPLQPLIRYELGDVVRIAADQSCACGRMMPIIEEVLGRTEDMLYTLEGRMVMRFDTVFKGICGLREAQVAQVARDRFEIRVAVDHEYDAKQEEIMIQHMKTHVGPGHEIAVIKVESIPRTSAGKFRAVVNECARARHQAEVAEGSR